MFSKSQRSNQEVKGNSLPNSTTTMFHCSHGDIMILMDICKVVFGKQVVRTQWSLKTLLMPPFPEVLGWVDLNTWPRNSSWVPEICFQLLPVLTSSVPNLATWLRSSNDIWNSSILSSEGFNSFLSSSFWMRLRPLWDRIIHISGCCYALLVLWIFTEPDKSFTLVLSMAIYLMTSVLLYSS